MATAALREALCMDQDEVEALLERLHEAGARIAGSFPLLHCCEPCPRDWAAATRAEVRLLAWIAKQHGAALPQPALERIGNWLQLAPLQDDWAAGRMDVDVFVMDTVHTESPPFGLLGWRRSPEEEPEARGLYAVLPYVAAVQVWRKGGTALNVIRLNNQSNVDLFIAECFDFSFCQATLASRPVRMRGTANVRKYAEILGYLRYRMEQWESAWDEHRFAPPGLSYHDFQGLAHTLAHTMQTRLAKYVRRRFTVENRDALLALIQEARSV
jgi:hypothetical protein